MNITTRRKQCKRGEYVFLPDDFYMGQSLERYGELAEHDMEMFSQLLMPGSVVVEAGANMGIHSVVLGKAVAPHGTVLAFEPQPALAAIAKQNIEINHLTRTVAVLQKAVGETCGEIEVPVVDYSQPVFNSGSISLIDAATYQHVPVLNKRTVELVSVDSLGLDSLDLLKVDVEGMECAVLRGARQTLEYQRPILFVENNHTENMEELWGLLQELEYDAWWMLTPLFNSDNFFKNPENIYGKTEHINIICYPSEAKADHGLPRLTEAQHKINIYYEGQVAA